MSSLVSLDDAFVVGTGCDLLGGYLLGRGLLAKPKVVAEQAATLIGSNPSVLAALTRSRVDGEAGIAILGLGFLLQAGGYLALISGGQPSTGGIRVPIAIALTLMVTGGVYLIAAQLMAVRLRRLAWEVAIADSHEASHPPEFSLALMGPKLDFGLVNLEDEAASREYVLRHFGPRPMSAPWWSPR